MGLSIHPQAEWLETDGLGGFASGTVGGTRTRRYHALLLVATTPPTGRVLLVNGFEAWVETPRGSFAISSQAYPPDIVHPDGQQRLVAFTDDPWPRWTFMVEAGISLEQELFVPTGTPAGGSLLAPVRPPGRRSAVHPPAALWPRLSRPAP